MAEIKYQYAYNENDEIVSINDFSKDESKQHSFKCISCGNTLLPRAIGSKSRRAHFYHKELIDCNGETYLHELGKSILKKKFDESDSFSITYQVKVECNNKSCALRTSSCSTYKHKTFNLKEVYDTCSVETRIDGFIADLLLTNSKKDIPPTLIEICVTHPCTQEKKDSGLKIIEVCIENERDIDLLKRSSELEEHSCDHFPDLHLLKVAFYSFKTEYEEANSIMIQRFIYNQDKDEDGLLMNIDCQKAQSKLIRDASYELNIVNASGNSNYNIEYNLIPLLWLGKYKGLRRCRLCKFYYATMFEKVPSCRLSKKYNTPQYPEMSYAEKCRSFALKNDSSIWELDQFKFLEVISITEDSKDAYRVIIAGSSSFNDYNLLRDRCDYYLSEKKKTHVIILLVGTSYQITSLIEKYANDRDVLLEYYTANWEKYGQQAAIQSNDEKISKADAVIAFWDGHSTYTGNLIDSAKRHHLPVAKVSY